MVRALAIAATLLVGCGGSPGSPDGGGSGGGAGATGGGGGASGGGGGQAGGQGGGAVGCSHGPPSGPRDHRNVVLGKKRPLFETDMGFVTVDLYKDGRVTPRGQQLRLPKPAEHALSMRGRGDVLVLTPDGEVAVLAHDDGTLSSFTFDGGTPVLAEANLRGSFAARALLMEPQGGAVWVLDSRARDAGGGLYRVGIGCSGRLTEQGTHLPGEQVHAAAWLHQAPSRAVVFAFGLGSSLPGADLHLAELSPSAPAVVSSTTAIGDPVALPLSVAVSADDAWVAVPDSTTHILSGKRVAWVAHAGGVLSPFGLLRTDNPPRIPETVVFSPYGASGVLFDDAYETVALDGGWGVGPRVQTDAPGRGISSNPVLLREEPLAGWMLVGELELLRELQFEPDGGVSDRHLSSTGLASDEAIMVVAAPP